MLNFEFYTKYLYIVITGGEKLHIHVYNKSAGELIRHYNVYSTETYYFFKELQYYIDECTEKVIEQQTKLKYKGLLDKFNKEL